MDEVVSIIINTIFWCFCWRWWCRIHLCTGSSTWAWEKDAVELQGCLPENNKKAIIIIRFHYHRSNIVQDNYIKEVDQSMETPPCTPDEPFSNDLENAEANENRTVPMFCAVCLLQYTLADRVCRSSNGKCSHMFHANWILQWLVTLGCKCSMTKCFTANPGLWFKLSMS